MGTADVSESTSGAVSDAQTTPHVSTGAGIAIAGAWIAGAAVTIALLFIIFAGNDHNQDAKITGIDAIMFLLLLASPMIASYNATKMILGIK
jgi:hypothetical protein